MEPVRLRILYHRLADLVTDHDRQFTRGGVLVRVPLPPGLALYDQVDLELALPGNEAVAVAAQVVQLSDRGGVAVAFSTPLPEAIAGAVRAARKSPGGDAAAPAPEHSVVAGSAVAQDDHEGAPLAAAPSPAAPAAADSLRQDAAAPPVSVVGAKIAKQIRMALYGNRDERAQILRDLNKSLHPHLLKNPGLGLDEVLTIAKSAAVSPDLLRQVAERREWGQRPEIAIALVRNPKTPITIAVKLVDFVSPADLKQLAKDNHTRNLVQHAARRKLLG